MLKFKLTALITGIACTLASIHIPIVSAETKPTETIHNIVVFAQLRTLTAIISWRTGFRKYRICARTGAL